MKVYWKQTYNPSKNTVCYTIKRVWHDTETITDLELRFTSMEDLVQKLGTSGFEIMDRYGDFDKNPFSSTSPNIILLCRLKR